jgi:energy-coupling factor transporter transmembrane protein EcfT
LGSITEPAACFRACGPFQCRSRALTENATLHPTTCLVAWLLSLVAVQGLQGSLLAVAFLVPPLFGRLALQRAIRLAWGARWLFLSLFVILAWGRAGEPVWGGAMAPSAEGLSEALTQVGRLLLVLMAVAVLRQRLSVPEFLTAAHRLLWPLRRCGVDTDRGIVRGTAGPAVP